MNKCELIRFGLERRPTTDESSSKGTHEVLVSKGEGSRKENNIFSIDNEYCNEIMDKFKALKELWK